MHMNENHLFDDRQRSRVRGLKAIMLWLLEEPNLSAVLDVAAARSGFSDVQIKRLFYRWKKEGDVALEKKSWKRHSTREPRIQLTQEDRHLLRQFALKTDSVQFAIECFADCAECRPELRAFIHPFRASRNYPTILRRAARVTPDERAQARGAKAYKLKAYTQLRDMTWQDAAGVLHPMVAGDLFEYDDMSLNQPYWFDWPYGGDPLSDKFGVRLGRQMLAACDVASGRWLGFDLIGRVRDAYRAEDIIRFMGRICRTGGIPRLGKRLERGAWAAKAVRGVTGANDEKEQETLASVRELVDLHYVYSPHSKGVIEGSFDMLQTILSLSGIQIGRTRGEYERTTQMMLACSAGRKHPAECGFRHINEMADTVWKAMEQANARPKLGRLLQGIPNEKWEQSVGIEPLQTVPDSHAHLFLPVKQIRAIDAGFVRLRVTHYDYTFSFAVPPECAHLGSEYRLLVCFDPAEPSLGARVFDAETDTRRDYEAQKRADYGTWAFAENAPQVSFSTRTSTEKRRYLAASRTAFRATGMQNGTGASVDQAVDGRGAVARMVRGAIDERKEFAEGRTVPQEQVTRSKEKGKAARALSQIIETEEVSQPKYD